MNPSRLASPATPNIANVGSALPGSFAAWRRGLDRSGVPAVIAIAGSRGKTTVVRMLEAILGEAGHKTAVWTDHGVEVEGRRERGELVPWSRALARLRAGDLDVAVQELDWDTVHAVGLPPRVYPLVGITNLCANSDACLVHPDTLRARRALAAVRRSVSPDGLLVANGDEPPVAADAAAGHRLLLVGGRRDSPLLRDQLRAGGAAGWIEHGSLAIGAGGQGVPVIPLAAIGANRAAAVGFQATNALFAAALAAGCGVPLPTIARALARYRPDPERMPGSFNVVDLGGAIVVVDRPAHPWFLRPALRALGQLPGSRLLRVVGRLDAIEDPDLFETGRLLGRGGGVVVLHGDGRDGPRADLLRHGMGVNEVPPLVLQSRSERTALGTLLRLLQPGDLAWVLAERPLQVLRTLQRAADPPRAA